MKKVLFFVLLFTSVLTSNSQDFKAEWAKIGNPTYQGNPPSSEAGYHIRALCLDSNKNVYCEIFMMRRGLQYDIDTISLIGSNSQLMPFKTYLARINGTTKKLDWAKEISNDGGLYFVEQINEQGDIWVSGRVQTSALVDSVSKFEGQIIGRRGENYNFIINAQGELKSYFGIKGIPKFKGEIGYLTSESPQDSLTVKKLNINGEIQWSKVLTSTYIRGYSVIDNSGKLLLNGEFSGSLQIGDSIFNSASKSRFVAKFGVNGNIEWAKAFYLSDTTNHSYVEVNGSFDSDENIYLVSHFYNTISIEENSYSHKSWVKNSFDNVPGCLIIKLSPQGQIIYIKDKSEIPFLNLFKVDSKDDALIMTEGNTGGKYTWYDNSIAIKLKELDLQKRIPTMKDGSISVSNSTNFIVTGRFNDSLLVDKIKLLPNKLYAAPQPFIAEFVVLPTAAPVPNSWNFTSNTGNSATIAIPKAIKPSTGTRLLTEGDAVGVFFVSGTDTISGGYGIWKDENLTITAWGDNEQTTVKDGFAAGDTILYKVWDGQSGTSYNALATYQSGSQLYSRNGVNVLSSLGVRISTTQSISLNAGWNTFSSYVLPGTTDLDILTAPIQPSLLLMKNGAGDIYWPSLGINEIGEWNFQHGYQAYMLGAVNLQLGGLKSIPEATGIPLEKGWNLISYLRRSNLNIGNALGGISQSLVAARDNNGKVYWPALGINALDSMRAGNGYYIMMSQPATLTYPSDIEGIAYKDKSPDEVLSAASEKKKTVHFTFRNNTGKNAVIGIPANSINGTVPNAEGDEIGIFANGKCVGASVWEGKNTAITVWGDDDQTQEKDGINPGEQMEIRVWKKSSNSEISAKAVQFKSGAGLKATNLFEADAIYELSGFKADTVQTGVTEISENSNIQIVYNSANDIIQVTLADAQNSAIELLDVNGKQLRSLQTETQISSISTGGIPSGAYFVQVKIGNEVSYKKIIIAR
jgi:hypothetical protein